MNEEHRQLVDINKAPALQARSLRIGLALLGAGVLLSASVFVVGGGWDRAPARSVGALEEGTAQNIRPIPTGGQATPTTDWAAIRYLAVLARPTATSTPVPPTSTPLPQSAQPVAPPGGNPGAPVVAAQPQAGCPTQAISGFALDLFNEINSARAQNGMGSLGASGCVAYLAQIRSNDMASRGYFAHQSPDGSSAFSLLDAYGVPSGWAGENLARNNYPTDQTVAVAIRDLMASPPHRENILNSHYTSLGVAVTLDFTGIYYYTMIFVGPA